jgi:hypothetical protein
MLDSVARSKQRGNSGTVRPRRITIQNTAGRETDDIRHIPAILTAYRAGTDAWAGLDSRPKGERTMSKQAYPQYRAMAFVESSPDWIVTLLDRWHADKDSAMADAKREAANGFRAVVYLEHKTSPHVLTESLLWESHANTQAWLDEHHP